MSGFTLILVQKLAIILTFVLANPKENVMIYISIFRISLYFNLIAITRKFHINYFKIL